LEKINGIFHPGKDKRKKTYTASAAIQKAKCFGAVSIQGKIFIIGNLEK
jgi:hypothetical protein